MKVNPYTKKKIPPTRYKNRTAYDFLQYIRVVFKWATENYDLSRPEIELLLYLYPKNGFTKKQFTNYQRLISIYQIKSFRKLTDEGWIRMFRPRKGKETALYVLTDKSKRLCSRMHRFCTGEAEIPTSPRSNALAREGGKRINNYYLDAIKQMNKDKDK